jgi:hypothetical protein
MVSSISWYRRTPGNPNERQVLSRTLVERLPLLHQIKRQTPGTTVNLVFKSGLSAYPIVSIKGSSHVA